MVIAHIRASNFYGGPERQIVGHIKSSQHFEHLVVTFCRSGERSELAEVCRRKGLNVAVITSRSNYQPTNFKKLRSILEDNHVSVICCHGYKPLIMSLVANIGINIPIVAFARGHTEENLKIKLYGIIERWCFKFAKKIVSVSSGYAKYLLSLGVGGDDVVVVRNAIDMKRFSHGRQKRQQIREQMGFTNKDILIATAGRLSPEKDQKTLIAAFVSVKKAFPDSHLLLCGEGAMRTELEKNVADRALSDVHFLGHRKDLDDLMVTFDVFVLPSLTEGLPNVLLEAAASQVPIVATDVGGVSEVVAHEKSGFLVRPKKPEELAKYIIRTFQEKKQIEMNIQNAKSWVEDHFSIEAQTRKLENIYHEVQK